ncbi:MAG: peptide chain release factor N(5)-glutamine methyltransferase [Candidatus Limnocylindrales bacterium]
MPPDAAGTVTLGRILEAAAARLRASGSETARLDAELLVAHALATDRTTVIAHPKTPLSPAQAGRVQDAVARRERGEPVAYIRGLKEFHGLALSVDSRVLIPRPDTELLVDLGIARAVATILERGRCRIADIGTGSGAVGIAVAASLRRRGMLAVTELLATDMSADALALATENAVGHGLADAIRFARADLLPPGEPPVDVLVANLPYVPSAELPRLAVGAHFEPALALDGGPDGLAIVRRLLELLPVALRVRGIALLEIGAGQTDAVRVAASEAVPSWTLSWHEDLAGIPRVVELAAP